MTSPATYPTTSPATLPMSAPTYRFSAACTGCGACLLTCPQHAIRPGHEGRLYVIEQRCDGCGECIEVCPADAITEVWR
jgi:Pyruvate/2-oxoacid:ferredoxin oxidoreductase delta subunit